MTMIRRAYEDPRLLILAIVLVIVGGLAGFVSRASREDPQSQVRWGYVTTSLPGAEPLEVESLISEPIERALREAGTIRSIESASLRGVSLVFIRLTDEVTDVAESWTRIQDKLSEVQGQLPARASVPVLVDERRWGSHTEIVALREQGDLPVAPAVLARWAKELNNRLSFVRGTRFTETFGIPGEEIQVTIDEDSIAATNITVQEISSRIQARDSEGLDSTSQARGHALPVSLAGDIDDMDRLRDLILRGDDDDRLLRLGDIASIQRGEHQPRDQSAFVQGRRAAVIATRMDEDYGIDAWTRRQQAVLDEFKASLPAELALVQLFSQKRYTDQRAASLYESLALGMLLVICVICLMMGWRAAIPICAALPLTLGLVFFLMVPFGITLHQMSIAGLVLALGMLIDNPIIVVDDIQRRLNEGHGAVEACRRSIRRLTTPLLGSNITTILGFVPIVLIGGPTGEFMEEMGWSVIACLAGSLLLSLTIIPILAAWCLRPASDPDQQTPLYVKRRTRRTAWVQPTYFRILTLALRFPLLLLALSMAFPVLGFVTAGTLKEQFFPLAERDHFHFSVRLPTLASIEQTEHVAMQAREIVLQHPEVEAVALFVGNSAPKLHYSMVAMEDKRPNYAQGLVQLNTSGVSVKLIRQIQQELDSQLRDAQCIVSMIEQGPPAPAAIEFRLYGPSLQRLSELGQQAQELLMEVPGVLHTRASLDPGGPLFGLEIDQHEAERSGLSDEVISRQLRDSLDGVVATNLSEEIEEVPVRVRLANSHASDPERVLSLPLVSTAAGPHNMPLGSVAKWQIDQQIFSIYRRNSARCNIISAYVQADLLPIEVEHQFQQLLDAKQFQLPPGYRSDFGGISAERDSAVGNLVLYSTIVAALMIAVLVITFSSFRMAAIILGVAILAVGMGLASLWIFGYPIGIVAIIGIAGMMGLAVNDSIVILSECQNAGDAGHSMERSVYGATRHVLTTTVTTVAGVLPLVLRGGVFWPPMMIVIAGGVVGATVIALGFTPACYKLLKSGRTTSDRKHP
ncbi:efflux RND transporter permease subunit [Roseimaritima ulvae]|uniref:Cobalt-zinc-cadmium resistance protein CzcA n=1 Tax=Roseimaritima ulvae TaxID=980254 RepID=A0A5B9QU14_9BACT|nr:efflux RND transporter permease subunit [Roseimaritima ulvae]QEG42528.1 Cobalt-zinc-cadmium resistance protein CzcA [Roseimaritima ulvae]